MSDTATTVLEHEAHQVSFTAGAGTNVVTVRRADGATISLLRLEHPVDDTAQLRAAAEEWIAERLGATIPDPVACDACGAPMEALMVGGAPRDALQITFSGGYGMHIDPITGPNPEAVICGPCATALTEAHPWIAAKLDEVI